MLEVLSERSDLPALENQRLSRSGRGRALRPGREQIDRPEGDPLFAQHYAQLVLPDPRHHAEAVRIMKRAIRKRPYAAVAYYFLANLLWEQREFHEATDLYRFAAALDDRDEQFAEGYFRAARVLEQTPEAMRFLQTRYNRTKGKLAAPARALFYALSEQDEMQSAFTILDQAAKVKEDSSGRESGSRAEIGEVLLFAAELRTDYNEPKKGLELLEAAKDVAARANWLRAAARMAELALRTCAGPAILGRTAPRGTAGGDAHRNLARIIADLEGRDAAVAWLRGWCDRHPTYHPLQQLLIDWLRGEPTAGPRNQGLCRRTDHPTADRTVPRRRLGPSRIRLASRQSRPQRRGFRRTGEIAGRSIRTARRTSTRSATFASNRTSRTKRGPPTKKRSTAPLTTTSPSRNWSGWPAKKTRKKRCSSSPTN